MAEPPSPFGVLAELVVRVVPVTPAIAGAVLGMTFGENLTVRGRVVSISTGLAAATWVAPALIAILEHFWLWGDLDGELLGYLSKAIVFLTGLFGMAVLAGLAQAFAKYSRDPFRLVRFKAGGLTIGGSSPEGESP